jgi:GNAT superfamily N-acetyltransferase
MRRLRTPNLPSGAPIRAMRRPSERCAPRNRERSLRGCRRSRTTSTSACAAFFARELDAPDPWVVAWVAVAGGRIAGSVVLTLAPTLPRRGVPQSGPDGRIRSVYVYPELRSRGVARALVVAAIADADARDVARLMLGASAMGRPLYESLGFVAKPDEMMYDP